VTRQSPAAQQNRPNQIINLTEKSDLTKNLHATMRAYMASELQSETSRRNGAKSRGPRTLTGKSNSAGNNRQHALLSKTIVIEGECAARFAALLASMRDHLKPRNTIEDGLVEDLATCRWRQRRLLAMETATLTHEMRRQDPDAAAQPPPRRAAMALGDSSPSSHTLDIINRYALRFDRQYDRALRRYLAIRSLPNQIGGQAENDFES
jgi:hypothetical protein